MKYHIIKIQKREFIRRSIAMFEWEKALSNISVDEKVAIFNRSILKFLSNFIPLATFVCNIGLMTK